MTGHDLRAALDRHDLSAADLARAINALTGRHYTLHDASRWQRGVRPVPDAVTVYIAALDGRIGAVDVAG